jgi:hypothetical protein
MHNKTRKNNKTKIIIKKFTRLADKPKMPEKGISYSVEKAENIDDTTGKKIDGDIFKKYQNGVLKRQIFVSKNREKKIIKKQLVKLQKGGKVQKSKTKKLVPTQEVIQVKDVKDANYTNDINGANVNKQVIIVQNGSTLGDEVKHGVAAGFGWGIGITIVDALFGNN